MGFQSVKGTFTIAILHLCGNTGEKMIKSCIEINPMNEIEMESEEE